MFTYLVLPFGSAPFLCEKMLILCTSYALWNGLFVLFRTVLYINVHHGLGQNAFSKIWFNFLTAKCKKKLRNQTISELFMVDSTGLEPVTPCTSSRTGHSQVVAAARLSRTFSMFGHFGTLT